jgi:hypothetical protein
MSVKIMDILYTIIIKKSVKTQLIVEFIAVQNKSYFRQVLL